MRNNAQFTQAQVCGHNDDAVIASQFCHLSLELAMCVMWSDGLFREREVLKKAIFRTELPMIRQFV